jgi:acetyltransferase-like isoleucine patch superfamily enzyme
MLTDITIGDHVWIGQNVTILKGARIGKGSIIAACALVHRDIPDKQLWGGVPARLLRENVSWVASHPANPHDVSVMLELVS